MNVFRFERLVVLNILFMGLGQDGRQVSIQHKFHLSLSLSPVEITERFSMNVYCSPAMYVTGTLLGVGDTEITETSYRQCDNELKYLT